MIDAKNEDNDDKQKKSSRESMNQFFKGLGAWALLLVMGNAFDYVYKPVSSHEVDSSATSALLMHSMGFSVFLLYFTGQVRWLILNGAVGLIMLWIFNASGMENKWVIISTHSVGYIVLATTVIIMILVFGGVVLVWSNLIDFLKDILVRYPQVKSDLREKKILEQILIGYISNIPKIEILQSRVSNDSFGDHDEEIAIGQKERSFAHARAGIMIAKEGGGGGQAGGSDSGAGSLSTRHKNKNPGSRDALSDFHQSDFCPSFSSSADAGANVDMNRRDSMLEVMGCKRPNYCFFCLKTVSNFCSLFSSIQI